MTWHDTPCQEWTGAISTEGYGTIGGGSDKRYAHRVAVTESGREIPPGYQVDHLCRNRRCVNPAHLEVVTQRENIARGASAGAVIARTGRCRNGHEMTSANAYVRPDTGDRWCKACRNARLRRNRACGVAIEAAS